MKQLILGVFVAFCLTVIVASQQPIEPVPAGTIIYFDLTSGVCPLGWTEYTAAQGLYPVGLPNGGTKAVGVVGQTALTNQENRNHTHTIAHTHTMSHTHTVSGTTSQVVGGQPAETDAGVVSVSDNHTHTFSVASSDSSAANTGSESTANSGTQSAMLAPYMQYPLCQKQ